MAWVGGQGGVGAADGGGTRREMVGEGHQTRNGTPGYLATNEILYVHVRVRVYADDPFRVRISL